MIYSDIRIVFVDPGSAQGHTPIQYDTDSGMNGKQDPRALEEVTMTQLITQSFWNS